MMTPRLQRHSDRAVPDTPDDYFADSPQGMAAYSAVRELLDRLGPVEVRVTRSHIGFVHGRGFAYLWRPGRWLHHPTAELVLSFVLNHPLTATRIKEVVHPTARAWIHHVELHDPIDIDAEVTSWLTQAYRQAAPRQRGRRQTHHT
jgi:hypothetical protein